MQRARERESEKYVTINLYVHLIIEKCAQTLECMRTRTYIYLDIYIYICILNNTKMFETTFYLKNSFNTANV